MPAIVDFHSHILPGMDDGSDSKKTTLALLSLLHEQQISIVCATPHFYRDREDIPSFLARREESIAQLNDCNISQQILLGAEVAWFPGIAHCEELDLLTVAGTRTLLLEMPFDEWSGQRMEDVLHLHLDREFHVVLAHPERFLFSKGNKQKINRMVDAGVSLQVNAGTLVRWTTRKQGLELLMSTSTPFLGSDCHNLKERAPRIGEARRVIEKKLGSEFLADMDNGMCEALGITALGNKKGVGL